MAQRQHDVWTATEVAEYLRVAERTVYDWAQKGILPGGKIGSTWRFRGPEVKAWFERRFKGANNQQVHLASVLQPQRVLFLDSNTKADALAELADCLAKADEIKDPDALRQGIQRREDMMSTGIGLGIGLPHVRLESITGPVMAVGHCQQPLDDYEAIDNEPVSDIFMIAAGKDQHAFHIKLLAAISKRMKNPELRELLHSTSSTSDFYELLVREP